MQVLLDGRDLRTLSLPWYRCALDSCASAAAYLSKHALRGLPATALPMRVLSEV